MNIRTDPESRSIILPVEAPYIADGVMTQLTSEEYVVKTECHMTLVPDEVGSKLLPEQFALLAHDLDAAGNVPIELDGQIYEISKPKILEDEEYERHSLVVPVRARVLQLAIQHAAQAAHAEDVLNAYDIPLHVTLATKPENPYARRGIGIASQEEWDALEPRPYNTKPWQAFDA